VKAGIVGAIAVGVLDTGPVAWLAAMIEEAGKSTWAAMEGDVANAVWLDAARGGGPKKPGSRATVPSLAAIMGREAAETFGAVGASDKCGPAQAWEARADASTLALAVIAEAATPACGLASPSGRTTPKGFKVDPLVTAFITNAARVLSSGFGPAAWGSPSMLVERTDLGSNASNCRDSKSPNSGKNLRRRRNRWVLRAMLDILGDDSSGANIEPDVPEDHPHYTIVERRMTGTVEGRLAI